MIPRPWWAWIPVLRGLWEDKAALAATIWAMLAKQEKERRELRAVIQGQRWVLEDVLPELRHARAAGVFRPKEIPEDDGCPEIDYLINRVERAAAGR